ncbi:hypothetical protein [Oryza sativa Japonica Group]|uniref:DUF4220 domain-containing protein n=2 Tax=Oryza sativa subsp. japonica TaxID=39947 RepID=Q5ZA23_ORYSJ|nr:hypothetical protein [Oryza sativa Japonica Group]BAD54017.1 hypothetical protein [Oryza sativa Japonica Group]
MDLSVFIHGGAYHIRPPVPPSGTPVSPVGRLRSVHSAYSLIISHYMSKVKAQSVVCPHVYPQYYSFQNHESQQCLPFFFTRSLIRWSVLIQIIKINTDTAFLSVSTDGRSLLGGTSISRTFVELSAYSIWTTGLRARCSFALGRNVKVISGYMAQVYNEKDNNGSPPPYITMGEEKQHLEKTPDGYRIKVSSLGTTTSFTLLTTDRIWNMWLSGDPLLVSQSGLKELCLSFSLFKSLRRRFAGHPLVEDGSQRALGFVLHGMLGDANDHDRMFQILINELAFANEFYYSCLPYWHFVGGALETLNLVISVGNNTYLAINFIPSIII